MESSPLVQQGIEAYKSGNREDAIRLLSQAIRERRDDEMAWLYLGASLDDPDKKRKAFQRVLEINPNNDKAKAALARLDPAPIEPIQPLEPATPAAPTAPSETPAPRSNQKPNWLDEGFAVPVKIEGAPVRITKPYLLEKVPPRLRQALRVYTNYDADLVVQDSAKAIMWDAVFTAGIGVAAMGVSDLLGRWLFWILSGFRSGLGGLILPVFSVVFMLACTGAGFYVGYYLSQVYLEGEELTIVKPKHAMAFAAVFLPMTLVVALLSLINAIFSAFGWGFVTFVTYAIALLDLGYGIILLTEVFDRIYGNQNRRSLIAAALAVGGYLVGVIIYTVLLRVFGTIIGVRNV